VTGATSGIGKATALAPGGAGWGFEFVLSSAGLGVTRPDPAFFAVVLRAGGLDLYGERRLVYNARQVGLTGRNY
jgi:NAD(P)-dependent dehydrogenase (short-subunit alcohol dehydrogenase family)